MKSIAQKELLTNTQPEIKMLLGRCAKSDKSLRLAKTYTPVRNIPVVRYVSSKPKLVISKF